MSSSAAERQGFEPWIRFWRIRTFQARSFDHSDISPERTAFTQSRLSIESEHKGKRLLVSGQRLWPEKFCSPTRQMFTFRRKKFLTHDGTRFSGCFSWCGRDAAHATECPFSCRCYGGAAGCRAMAEAFADGMGACYAVHSLSAGLGGRKHSFGILDRFSVATLPSAGWKSQRCCRRCGIIRHFGCCGDRFAHFWAENCGYFRWSRFLIRSWHLFIAFFLLFFLPCCLFLAFACQASGWGCRSCWRLRHARRCFL